MQKLNASPARTQNEYQANFPNRELICVLKEDLLAAFSLREIAFKCDDIISDLMAYEAETSGTVVSSEALLENIFFLRTVRDACNAMAVSEGQDVYVPGVTSHLYN